MGDFSFDLACYQADNEQRERDRLESMKKRNEPAGSRTPPEWGGG